MWCLLLLFIVPAVVGNADLCEQCISESKHWCPSTASCIPAGTACTGAIKRSLNCPRMPDPAFAYNDSYGRYVVAPLVAAVYNEDPGTCFRTQLPTVTLYRRISVPCSTAGPNTTCTGYTAVDNVKKVIITSFAGTNGAIQLGDEILSFFKEHVAFYNNGRIFKYFHDAFFDLWNGGMEKDVRNLKYLHPDYNLVVVGHSLGASIACTFASYMIKFNLWTGPDTKLVTIGQPRTGDYQFATWHDQTFPYSYRIVHHQDPVPHVPPSLGPDETFHHRYEVWYNNDMKIGQPYVLCPEADGFYCSNKQLNENTMDHLVYYDINIGVWGIKGCPNNQ